MKSNHLFSFGFDNKLLEKDFEKVNLAFQYHHNPAFYDGEWSGIALRKPEKAVVELDAGNAEMDSFIDTPLMSKAVYVKEVLEFFKSEKTSVRLLKLTPGSFIKPHSDERLGFWDGYVRLHIPILTNPDVEFISDGSNLKMLPGQCWFADFSKTHSVANLGTEDRIHLIIDLVVNDWLRALFIKEGILKEGEMAPDPMDKESDEFKIATVQALVQQNTEASMALAKELIARYGLNFGQGS